MARDTRSKRLAKKAQAALIAAIEVYNKPDFFYREESFAILCVNAWELLLKAKVLDDNAQDLKSLHVYEKKKLKDGSKSERKRVVKRNVAGSPITISVHEAMGNLGDALAADVKANLDALIGIRDNAVHFINPSFDLRKRVLEIGTASVQNYVVLARQWFRQDFSRLNLYLMPIGFLGSDKARGVVATDQGEKNLLAFLGQLIAMQRGDPAFAVAVEVDIQVRRADAKNVPIGTPQVQQAKGDPTALKIVLSDEKRLAKYPWNYEELCKRLRARYLNFKVGPTFHRLRKALYGDERYVYEHYWDPKKRHGEPKRFFNPCVVEVLDKHYTRKQPK